LPCPGWRRTQTFLAEVSLQDAANTGAPFAELEAAMQWHWKHNKIFENVNLESRALFIRIFRT